MKGTLNPVWDTMVEILVADFTQTTLSFVVLDKDTNAIKLIKEDRGDFMGSCNLSLTEESPIIFKKNLDLLYKVKGSGMMKAGKLCVSAVFRPVPSVANSEIQEIGQGLPEGEPPGPKDAKTDAQTLEALLRAERGTLEINIYQGRSLVAKDVNGKSDPFVTVKEGSDGKEKFRTRTIVNTLDPVWNETAIVAMPDTNGLLLLEVWDKDPLTQERMGQIGFTTEKLKDLGKAPYEKDWYRLRGVKSGELQIAFKYTSPQADEDKANNNVGNLVTRVDKEKTSLASADSVSSNGKLPTVFLTTSPFSTRKKQQKDKRSVISWSGTTQNTRQKEETQEQSTGNVFAPGVYSNSFPRVETKESYKLKDWPRKGRRFKSVVDTVRAFRRDKTLGNMAEAETKNETEVKNKPRSAATIRKKFSFLKDHRQRSVSESQLATIYGSRDDTDPLLRRENEAAEKLVRRSSENITGSTTLTRQKSEEKYSFSLPNTHAIAMPRRSNSARFIGTRSSRSTASCSSNSHGSSPTHSQHKCPACNFDVLILSECPACKASQQDLNGNHSLHERLIN